MTESAFEQYVNIELPKRIGTNANPLEVSPGMVPVTTGVGLLTEFRPYSAGGSGEGSVVCTIPFKETFTLDSWTHQGNEEYTITYTPEQHLQGNTKYLTVFVYSNNKNITPVYYISNMGEVVISAALIFDGYVIISNLGVGTVPYKKEVTIDDWADRIPTGYSIMLDPSEHGQGNTKFIAVFVYADNMHVPPKYQVTDTGVVSLYTSIKFDGYIIVSNLGNSLSHTASGEVPLAPLTSTGQPGKLMLVNGIAISYVAPT
jgi:hypothetical protein